MHLPSGPVFLLFTRAQQRMNGITPLRCPLLYQVPISLSPTRTGRRACVWTLSVLALLYSE